MSAAKAKALRDGYELREVRNAQRWFERIQDRRRTVFLEAREAGCTWVEIGRAAGVTEADARQLVNRTEKAAA